MLLRLDNLFFNPGIKGWVPADKSALISKGSQHLLIKRCVGPYPTLLTRRCGDLLCLDSMGVSSMWFIHMWRDSYACSLLHCCGANLAVRVCFPRPRGCWRVAAFVKNSASRLKVGWVDGTSSAPGLVPVCVTAEIRGVHLGRAGWAPHELVKCDGV